MCKRKVKTFPALTFNTLPTSSSPTTSCINPRTNHSASKSPLTKPIMEPSNKADQLFKFNTESPVEWLIKSGVLSTFSHYNKQTTRSTDNIRHDIASVLESLSKIKLPPEFKDEKAQRVKTTHIYKFFSSRELALVEIEKDQDTDITTIEHFPDLKDERVPVKTARHTRNEQFKDELADWIVKNLSVCRNSVMETVLKGIYSMLLLAEDSAGPFVDQFEMHVELFEQLAKVYHSARAEDLDKKKGCYSHGLAVEEALAALDQA